MVGTARFDFSGTNVLVFGGTSGINLGIAEAFYRCGAGVGIVGRNAEKAQKAAKAMAGLELAEGVSNVPAPRHYIADVRSYEAVEAVYAAFAEDFGPVDTLVSGAAGNFPALATGMSPNGFKAVVDIDLMGTYHVMRAGHERLRGPGANVINISAPQAQVAMLAQSHVSAAKAGVDMLTKSLCLEWGPKGIRVNSVIPGPIDETEGMARLAPDEGARKAVIASVPLRRMGLADDVAQACLFLASDAGRYVSGAILPADGGWLAASVRL